MADSAQDWYKNAVIYQIYPRSFADSNGDGVGDLNGITSKLDYLNDLCVDGIWLSPIYTSPMADFGYDVSDYRNIDPTFGTLDDFDRLVTAAHDRGIKVLMDLIPNHTSDQHAWFLESSSSRDNPKRDWYIWKDPKPGDMLPNNWQSVFGGPSWTYEPKTAQYYMHSFLKEQPDLNWDNPDVRAAMQDIMRFWCDRGVDGFRVDAVLFTSKDLEFRDNPAPKDHRAGVTDDKFETEFSHGVGKHLPEYVKVMTDVAKEYPGRCIFFEAHPSSGDAAGYADLYSFMDQEVAAPFYFAFFGVTYDWKAKTFSNLVDTFEALLPENAISAYVLGNHDMSRVATRLPNELTVRAAAVILLTLPGAKFMYYGDELGLPDQTIPPEFRVDPSNVPRDAERTPMRWTPEANGGFTMGQPWLPVGVEITTRNVTTMLQDPSSILSLYKQLLTLRREHPALLSNSFEPLQLNSSSLNGYKRSTADETLIVLINFTDIVSELQGMTGTGRVLISSVADHAGKQGDLANLSLDPYEAVIIQLD